MNEEMDNEQQTLAERLAGQSFKEAMADLQASWCAEDAGTGADEPVELPIGEVIQIPNVFQVRGGVYAEGEVDDAHLRDLRGALKNTGKLDPITVWRCAGAWILIDGHHRIEAYAVEERTTIPVEVFRGTVKEALRKAGEGNSKAKLPMSLIERQNFAWRITSADRPDCKGRWSLKKSEVVEFTASRKTSVESMRKVVRMMIERNEEPSSFSTWKSALDWKNGISFDPDIDGDDLERLMADRLLDKLNKGVPKIKHNQVRPFAMALSDFTGRNAKELLEALASELGFVVTKDDEPLDF